MQKRADKLIFKNEGKTIGRKYRNIKEITRINKVRGKMSTI